MALPLMATVTTVAPLAVPVRVRPSFDKVKVTGSPPEVKPAASKAAVVSASVTEPAPSAPKVTSMV